MTLNDRMVYAGIVNSRRMAQLTWFQRDFFRSLIHAADGHGRFEADAVLLRSVLYGVLSHKVSVRDVQEAMTRCHQLGLVKLYQVEGRGYGKVINYRQTLAKRRALYPDEDGPRPEPELFENSSGKKEEKSPQPPAAAGGGNASLAGTKPPKRFARRLPKPDTLRDELAGIEREMTEILRPGGCAFNTTPPPEKQARLDKLFAEREKMMETIELVREELVRRAAEDVAR